MSEIRCLYGLKLLEINEQKTTGGVMLSVSPVKLAYRVILRRDSAELFIYSFLSQKVIS